MNGHGKSDGLIVSMKPANKAEPALGFAAESVERRGLTKGNLDECNKTRTQCRMLLQQALGRIQEAAKRDRAKSGDTLLNCHILSTLS